MSEKERKILTVTAAALAVVFLIYFVKPALISSYQPDTYDVKTEQTGNEAGDQTQKAGIYSPDYRFRSSKHLSDHYEKHGIDMGFDSAEEYERAAAAVVQNPDALHKTEAEDGDDVYYLEATNEFVIVSRDGYIRTYFKPDSGIRYYNRQ